MKLRMKIFRKIMVGALTTTLLVNQFPSLPSFASTNPVNGEFSTAYNAVKQGVDITFTATPNQEGLQIQNVTDADGNTVSGNTVTFLALDPGTYEFEAEYIIVPPQEPVTLEIPPTEEELPPAEEELPPAEEELPPTEEELPPAEEELPPVEEELPPIEEELPPVEEELPPAEEELPPVEEELPPAEEELPPVEEEFLVAQGHPVLALAPIEETLLVEEVPSQVESLEAEPSTALEQEGSIEETLDAVERDTEIVTEVATFQCTVTEDDFVRSAEDGFTFNAATNTIVSYTPSLNASKNIVIPETIGGVEVKHIGDNAFAGLQLTGLQLNSNLLTIGSNAFYNNPEIKGTLIIPEGVTGIGDGAFGMCKGLTDVSIPDGVTVIEEYLFYECSDLTTVNIPEGVTSIGAYAFYNCGNLTSLTIPDGVTSIGAYAFSSCSSLTSVTIPSGMSKIEPNTFSYCSGLTSLTISEGITNIGELAFYRCRNITSLVIPGSVVDIETYAFGNCESLASLTISEGVTSIGDSAFGYCYALTSVTIPNSVTSIHRDGFVSAGSPGTLETINIPGKLGGSIENQPWGSSGAMVWWKDTVEVSPFLFSTESKTITKYSGSDETVIIPPSFEIDGTVYPVERIAEGIFESCAFPRDIKSVVFPDSVVEISERTFWPLPFVETIDISGKLSGSIRNEPWGATPETMVRWKDTEEFDSFIFNANGGSIAKYTGTDKNVVIPSFFEVEGEVYPVKTILDHAFRDNKEIESVVIPDSVTKIGVAAFLNCQSLTSVTIPDSVTRLGESAFYGCGSLTNVTIPDGVTSIEPQLFRECFNLTSVIIPEGVTNIEGSAFLDCSSLTSLTIPGSITSVGEDVFGGCSGLTSLIISPGVTSIRDRAFQNCSGLTSVTIPDSVTSIGKEAFRGCSKLTGVTIPGSVTSIGNNAFDGSGLTSVIIPGSAKMGDRVFQNCQELTSVFVESRRASMGVEAFKNTPKLTEIKIDMPREAAPGSITSTQPWGASSTVKVVYNRDAVQFSYTTEKVPGEYARNVDVKAFTTKGTISRMYLPDGTSIHVGSKEWQGVLKAAANESYTYRIVDADGTVSTHHVIVDDIGKIDLSAEDGMIPVADAPAISKEGVYTIIGAAAKDELGDVPFEISDEDLRGVQGLTHNGMTATVKVAAASPFGTTAEKTVTITAKGDEVDKDKYVVSVNKTGEGRVTVDQGTDIAPGTVVTFTVTPAKGWKLASVRVNGAEVEGTSFIMPHENLILAVVFEQVDTSDSGGSTTEYFNIHYKAAQGGSIEGKENQRVQAREDTSSVTAAAQEGYEFVKWSDGKTTATRHEVNVRANATYTAEFRKKEVPSLPDPTPMPDPKPAPDGKPTTDTPLTPDTIPVAKTQTQDETETQVVVFDRADGSDDANGQNNLGTGEDAVPVEDAAPGEKGEEIDVQKPGFGQENQKNCIVHFFLFALAVVVFVAMMIKRRKNEIEENELYNQ